MLKCSMPTKAHTIHSHMPIPEKGLKPDSVIAEEEAMLKKDRSSFRPAWMQSMDRFRIPYKSLAYRVIVHILAIVGLIYLLSQSLSVPSITAYPFEYSRKHRQQSSRHGYRQQDKVNERCQKSSYANLLRRLVGISPDYQSIQSPRKIFADASSSTRVVCRLTNYQIKQS